MIPVVKDLQGNILKEGNITVTGRVRYGIYGTYELCIPQEYGDILMTTLRFHQRDFFRNDELIGKIKNKIGLMEIATLRKLIGCEPIPEFKTDQQLPLPSDVMENIRIIPIGIRYDQKEWLSTTGLIHERI